MHKTTFFSAARRCLPARQWARLATLTALVATGASAEPLQLAPFELERLELNPNGQGSLVIGTGQMMPEGTYRVSILGHYQNDPLVLQTGAAVPQGRIVEDRWTAHFMLAWAFASRAELDFQLPVIFAQDSDRGPLESVLGRPSSSGLGTPTVSLRVAPLQQDDTMPVDVSLELGLGLPLGSGDALGRDFGASPRVTPKLMVGRAFPGLRAGFEAGLLFRPNYTFAPNTFSQELGDMVRLGASVATTTDGFNPELAVRADLPFGDEPESLQVLAGGRLPVGRSVEVYGMLGPAFGKGVGTPTFRALLGVAFGEAGVRCVAGGKHTASQCPDLDDDKDGVANGDDFCPADGGNVDFRGCPVKDQDADGVADADDKCVDKAGVAELQGCPDQDKDGIADADDKCVDKAGVAAFQGCPDTDKDGIADAQDRCVDKAGVEAFQGCPDQDNDGFEDDKDKCPASAGIAELKGCPAVDTDGDTVADHLDNCPSEAGVPDNQGCPAAQKQLVVIKQERLEIKDRIYFDSGKATIQPRSFALMDQIAKVLTAQTRIEKVVIEGHTDNTGVEAKNLTLSQARADAVRTYLVGKGVAAERLESKGYGQSRPVGPNETPEGRAANRRVEFVIPSNDPA